MMLPRTSPTKAIRLRRRVTIVAASRQSPLEGERPTTGSDEGNSSKGIACTEQPITRAHENWGSSACWWWGSFFTKGEQRSPATPKHRDGTRRSGRD